MRVAPRASTFLRVVGRLKAGVTMAEADAEAGVFRARQRAAHALHRDGRYAVSVESLQASLARRHGPSIVLLFGAVGVLLAAGSSGRGSRQVRAGPRTARSITF